MKKKSKRYYNRIFKSPEEVQGLVKDYQNQVTKNLSVLARKYKVDRSCIYYWLGFRKYGKKTVVTVPKNNVIKFKKVDKYADLLEEKVNEGRDYKDYIKSNPQVVY